MKTKVEEDPKIPKKDLNNSNTNIAISTQTNVEESQNKKSSKKKLIIILVIAGIVIIAAAITLICVLTKNDEDDEGTGSISSNENTNTNTDSNNDSNTDSNESNEGNYEATIDGSKISYSTANLINKDTIIEEGEFSSSNMDETVFLVVDGAKLTLGPGIKITKTGQSSNSNTSLKTKVTKRFLQNDISGDQPEGNTPPEKPEGEEGNSPPGGDNPPEKPEGGNGENPPEKPDDGDGGEGGPGGGGDDKYSFYGINSAIVIIGEGSMAVIDGVTISTNSYGSNAVVAVNQGEVTITNSTISTSQDSSRGLHATYKGKITSENVSISTQGGSCANLATDRGEGTIIAKKMNLSTKGNGSPLIYSTGSITVSNSTGTSTGAQICVIEGKNSAKIENCNFSCTGKGNRGEVDIAGVMVYQSMSGDADIGEGNFYAKNSNFSIDNSDVQEKVPMFFVTNTKATIDIENVEMKYFSGVLMDIKGTDEWGTKGKNGGEVNFSVKKEKLNGKIAADDISYVIINYDENTVEKNELSTEGNVTLISS